MAQDTGRDFDDSEEYSHCKFGIENRRRINISDTERSNMKTAATTTLVILGLVGGLVAFAMQTKQSAMEEKVNSAKDCFHVTSPEWDRIQNDTKENAQGVHNLEVQVGKIEGVLETQAAAFARWEATQKQGWLRIEQELAKRNP